MAKSEDRVIVCPHRRFVGRTTIEAKFDLLIELLNKLTKIDTGEKIGVRASLLALRFLAIEKSHDSDLFTILVRLKQVKDRLQRENIFIN